jgi:hypothetical protein
MGHGLDRAGSIVHQPIVFCDCPQASGAPVATKPSTLRLDQVKIQWDAFQSLRCDLAAMIEHLGDDMASANQIHITFGITPTIVRRLAARGKVRKTGRRRKRYHVRDVLLEVLHGGTGRVRHPRAVTGYGKPRSPAGTPVPCASLPPASSYVIGD